MQISFVWFSLTRVVLYTRFAHDITTMILDQLISRKREKERVREIVKIKYHAMDMDNDSITHSLIQHKTHRLHLQHIFYSNCFAPLAREIQPMRRWLNNDGEKFLNFMFTFHNNQLITFYKIIWTKCFFCWIMSWWCMESLY